MLKLSKIKKLMERFVNRETIVYGIAGLLTTAVNMVTYYILCYWIIMDHLLANIIAWMVAVTFAYFVNAGWVFRDKRSTVGAELAKMVKFIFARIFSLGVEEGGLFLFVNLLKYNNMAVKAGLAVIVIVINYIWSKFYVFNSSKEDTIKV